MRDADQLRERLYLALAEAARLQGERDLLRAQVAATREKTQRLLQQHASARRERAALDLPSQVRSDLRLLDLGFVRQPAEGDAAVPTTDGGLAEPVGGSLSIPAPGFRLATAVLDMDD